MSNKKPSNKDDFLKSIPGMRDIGGDEYYEMQGFFEKAQEISMYYGFEPIDTPILENEDLFLHGISPDSSVISKEMYLVRSKSGYRLALRPEGTTPIIRSYIENNLKNKPQPRLFYYYGPLFRHEKPGVCRFRQHHQFGLEVVGTDKPIADALVIQTAYQILKDSGAKDLVVLINSVGDIDSQANYLKELKAFYRKHSNDMTSAEQQLATNNAILLLDSKSTKLQKINGDAPESVNYLTSASKAHFMKVLEYLEGVDIPYKISKTLTRGLGYYSETVFEIEQTYTKDDKDETMSLCGGGRYNYLAQKLKHKKEIHAVGVGIGVERVLGSDWWVKHMPRIVKKPKIYFIQLGYEAKLKSLPIVEMLRKAKISVVQQLSKDSISVQLAAAEKSGMPVTIIFGKREALDGTVMVRNMTNQSQETIKIDNLVTYIKNMKV